MELVWDILVTALLVIGGAFTLIGSFGLLKLSDLMKRLHAPTKATSVGVGGCLMASMAYFAMIAGTFTVHELLVTLFLFLTAPITANMIAKAHMHVTGDAAHALPPTGTEEGWATFDAAPGIEETKQTAQRLS